MIEYLIQPLSDSLSNEKEFFNHLERIQGYLDDLITEIQILETLQYKSTFNVPLRLALESLPSLDSCIEGKKLFLNKLLALIKISVNSLFVHRCFDLCKVLGQQYFYFFHPNSPFRKDLLKAISFLETS